MIGGDEGRRCRRGNKFLLLAVGLTALGNKALAGEDYEDYIDAVQRYDRLIDPANPDALRLLPLNLEVRETRGFIYLKLGNPALALNEYNSALTIAPNRALLLYGRGLTRIKMGNANGKSDQEAALTIERRCRQRLFDPRPERSRRGFPDN